MLQCISEKCVTIMQSINFTSIFQIILTCNSVSRNHSKILFHGSIFLSIEMAFTSVEKSSLRVTVCSNTVEQNCTAGICKRIP